jgi:hypothetical protein
MATGSRGLHSVDGCENKWGFGKNAGRGKRGSHGEMRRIDAFKMGVTAVR